MIDWNDLRYSERMMRWKELRDGIAKDSEHTALHKVFSFWSRTPFSNEKFSYDFIEMFTPWELLERTTISEPMIVTMMFYTLKMAHPKMKIDLRLLDERLVIIVNERYLLDHTDILTTLDFDVEKLRPLPVDLRMPK